MLINLQIIFLDKRNLNFKKTIHYILNFFFEIFFKLSVFINFNKKFKLFENLLPLSKTSYKDLRLRLWVSQTLKFFPYREPLSFKKIKSILFWCKFEYKTIPGTVHNRV